MTQCLDLFDLNTLYTSSNSKAQIFHSPNIQQNFFQDSMLEPPSLRTSQKRPPTKPSRPSSATVRKEVQQKPLLFQQRKESLNESRHSKVSDTRSQQISNTKSTIRIKSARKSTLIDIAYNDQIQKVQKDLQRKGSKRANSLSSVSSSTSLDSSFEQMENRLGRRGIAADMTDQKYMIQGFFQMIKEHKKIVDSFRAIMIRMSQVLMKLKQDQPDRFDENENAVKAIDIFFQENADIMRAKINEFYTLHASLERLIRMNINEPYLIRAKRRAQQMARQRSVFEFMEIYLVAFEFLRIEAYQYFQEEASFLDDLETPPSHQQQLKLQENFFARVEQIREELEQTSDNDEGRIIANVFKIKIDKIVDWHNLIFQTLNFKYQFNVRYNLETTAPTYKIIKSKKIYTSVYQEYRTIQDFMVENFSMPEVYLNRLDQLIGEIELIKQQVLQWNQKLRQNPKYKEIMSIIQFNKKIKKDNKQLDAFLKLRNKENENIQTIQQYHSHVQALIEQISYAQQKIKPLLKVLQKSEDIKKDEYLQKIFDKAVILILQFEELKKDAADY